MVLKNSNRPFVVSIAYAVLGLALVGGLWAVGWMSPGAGLLIAVLVFAGSYWMNERPTIGPEPEARAEAVDTAVAAAILNALPDPVVLLNKKREVLALNQAAVELMGSDAKGKDLSQSFRHPSVLESVSASIKGNQPGGVEITVNSPVRRTFEAYATNLAKVNIGLARAILVLHDVTSSRQAEEMRADFVANVSHELRSPLSALTGFIETLQGPAKDDAQAQEKFLGVMQGEAGRMARLIDDLLSLSRIETNEHVRPSGSVNIGQVLEQVREALSIKSEKRNITIEIECDKNLPTVPGDADQLTEVFQNLIDNAIKYGPEDQPIVVRTTTVDRIPDVGGAGVCISVCNRGEPIAPEQLPRLTERFYRVDKGRSRQMGGTGLGLAIVKHIVARHRGRMIVQSNNDAGTVFSVYLPVKEWIFNP